MKAPKEKKPPKKTNKRSALDDSEEDEEEKFVHPPPKRAPSPWIFFNVEFCKKYVEDGGERKNAFTKASEAWNSMSEDKKKPYNDQSEEAKAAVEKQT